MMKVAGGKTGRKPFTGNALMNYISLFSGASGGDLACQHLLGWNCIGYVEWEDYCVRVIEQRIKDGFLDDAPIFHCDIRRFINQRITDIYKGMVDVVVGGPPCQGFSVAGNQKGADDPRNMWPAMRDVIREVGPRFAFVENVPGLISCGYLATILSDLAEIGYDARWGVLGAADVGAPHKRNRLWIVAHARHSESQGRE